MTDTVNVPEAIGRLAAVANGASVSGVYGGEWCLNGPSSFRAHLRTLLAAAPKAEPVVSCKNCGTVRGATNECDCSRHDGSVPEWEAVHPEAPKVEQEPAAWQVWLINSEGEGHWSDISKDDRQKLEYFRSTGREMRPLFPPAPASDELLEAIDMDDFNIIGEWIEGGEKGSAPSGRVKGLWQSVRRVIAIAKHKGPQS